MGQALKSKLGMTQNALSESVSAIASFVKNLKLMVESSEASAKFIKDLKKTESKKFLKEQEAIDSKTNKVVEQGKKASIIETEIDSLNRELKNMKKRKQSVSATKNMDKKTITEKIALLTKDKEKQTEEYNKSRSDLSQQLKIFNEVKDLILRTFNAQSSSIDARMKDNVAFFRKKFTEMITKLTFLKSDPQDPALPAQPTTPTPSADSEPQTPKDPGSPLSTAAPSLDHQPTPSNHLPPPVPGNPPPPAPVPPAPSTSPYQPPSRSVGHPHPVHPQHREHTRPPLRPRRGRVPGPSRRPLDVDNNTHPAARSKPNWSASASCSANPN